MSILEVNTALIHRAQQGDRAVIAALYEHYHSGVYRYLYYRVEDRQTAEDLTSEVFLRMLRFLSGFHPPSDKFSAWLFQIARNLATDHYRSRAHQRQAPLEENLVAGDAYPDLAVERGLTRENLRCALDRLNEDQRDVIVLRFVSGLPISDVAQALGKSEDAVKGLQRRALLALREILLDWEVGDAEPRC